MEHTTSAYNPCALRLGSTHAQSEVFLQFLLEAVANVAWGAELALAAEEGRVVDCEEHWHGRFVNGNGRKGLRIFEIADRIANLEVLQAYYGTDITWADSIGLLTTHALEGLYFLYLRLLKRTVAVSNGALHAFTNGAAVNATYGDTARIVRVVERGDEHLRSTLKLLRSGDYLDNLVE